MMSYSVVLVALVGLVSADFDPELHAKYLTMPKLVFIEHFNAQNYSWKIADYGDIQERYPASEHVDNEYINKIPFLTHDLEGIDLPENFDARLQWPKCETISDMYDQEGCGSSFAFATSMTASDRICIHKDKHVRLSVQDFECMKKRVCVGGIAYKAFEFWKEHGLVSQECKPYNILKLYESKCGKECVDTKINYEQDKHYAENIYKIKKDSDQIKAELFKNGPIQASFKFYSDLLDYKTGVYEHKYGDYLGVHSVRVIGYGVADGKDYWLAGTSLKFGNEENFFKIQAFQDDVAFEDSMCTGMPK